MVLKYYKLLVSNLSLICTYHIIIQYQFDDLISLNSIAMSNGCQLDISSQKEVNTIIQKHLQHFLSLKQTSNHSKPIPFNVPSESSAFGGKQSLYSSFFHTCICPISVTCVRCGIRSTLCWEYLWFYLHFWVVIVDDD